MALAVFPLSADIDPAYIWILKRRRRYAVRYSSLALVRDALPRRSWLRQHLPFIFFLAALTGLILALARPVNIISVPAGKATIILTIDVSRSMCSTDIKPTRIQAAENAALSFIQRQSSNSQIGLVAFSSFAELIQPPTSQESARRSQNRNWKWDSHGAGCNCQRGQERRAEHHRFKSGN